MPETDGVLSEILRAWWRRPESRVAAVVFFAVIAAAMSGWLLLSDVDWKRNHDAAIERAGRAVNAGDIEAARDWLRRAVGYNPYSAEAHYRLAEILNVYFADNESALRHYLHGLEYAPGHHAAREAAKAVAILDMIMAGLIEDPLDAARDMALAAENDSYDVFVQRLGPVPAPAAQACWDGWRKRGPGKPIRRRLEKNDSHDFNAILDFAYEDGTSMSMHFFCRIGEPWRLTVGSPDPAP